jgi:trk system potassium uptake protein
VILGCGRVGSMLAAELDSSGHSVSVIDQEASAFKRLSKDFKGTTITGIGFDRDRLIEAGIDNADAFIAVSSGDNSNILAARVARETFGVKNVIARIYDPRRAEVYERLGIPTVATVSWTADQILRHVAPIGAAEDWHDPSGSVTLAEVIYHESWVGLNIKKISDETNANIAIITRYGKAVLPDENSVLQDGDAIHVLAKTEELQHLITKLGAERSN